MKKTVTATTDDTTLPRPAARAARRDLGFWQGKQPCWEMTACSPYVREKCAAYLNPDKPCWELPETQCELVLGLGRQCDMCNVARRYRHAAPSPAK